MIWNNRHLHAHRAAAKALGAVRLYQDVRVLFAVACLFLFVTPSEAGLKIYYLRHGEAGHNVVKEWAKTPKEERPVYVGNPNVFTPKGETQVAAVAGKLQKYHFDFIAVSSMWHTRHTILPYLKATDTKAEIWPELHEINGGSGILSAKLPPPSSPILNAGTPVKLPPDEAPYFSLRAGATNDFKLPPEKDGEQESACRFVVQSAIDMIHQRFGGTDKAILLVGHGNSGKAMLRLLTNNRLADIPPMANTGIWMVEEQPNGQFKLEIYNDAPYETHGAVSAQPR
jgi:broad specificity phosphatase PhoE